jgi:hypothetical protein
MNWPYEHWDNGKVYLHQERWLEFKDNINIYGNGYPHNWDHKRISFMIHSPRDILTDVPAPGHGSLKHKIEDVDKGFSTIYEPFPAFFRSNEDPEGWLPSWNIWAEDKHTNPIGEELSILTTGPIDIEDDVTRFMRFSIPVVRKNQFIFFRKQFWAFCDFFDYGIGPNPPMKLKKKQKFRSVYDSFEKEW